MQNPEATTDGSHFEVTIPSETAAGQKVQDRIIEQLEAADYPPRGVFGMRLALEEAIVNAIKHGNKFAAEKSVVVTYQMVDDLVTVTVTDEGAGFDPALVPDPTDDENLDKPSGRGIMLMQSFLNRVEYLQGGRQVLLELSRVPEDDA